MKWRSRKKRECRRRGTVGLNIRNKPFGPRLSRASISLFFPFSVRCLRVFYPFHSLQGLFLRSCLFERETLFSFLSLFFFLCEKQRCVFATLISFLASQLLSRIYVCVCVCVCVCISVCVCVSVSLCDELACPRTYNTRVRIIFSLFVSRVWV